MKSLKRPSPKGGRVKQKPSTKEETSISERLRAIEGDIAGIKHSQEELLLKLMKFTILRHMSLLSIVIEQGSGPREANIIARKWLDDGVQTIVKAPTLDELKTADVDIQRRVRQLITKT